MRNDLPKDTKIVPIRQASEILGVSIDTVRRWDKKGVVHSERPNGKDRYFSVEELEKVKLAQPLSISEVAKRLHISQSTLRRLEKKGLIQAERNASGERIYTQKILENFLESEYFLRKHEVEEKILEPLKEMPEQVAAGQVTEENSHVSHEPSLPEREANLEAQTNVLQLAEKKDIEELSQEIKVSNKRLFTILGGNLVDQSKKLRTTRLWVTLLVGLPAAMGGLSVMLIIVIAALFLAYPKETARFFAEAPLQEPTIATEKRPSSSVLGASVSANPTASANIVGTMLRPFALVSLQLVKQVQPQTYSQVAPQVVTKSVTNTIVVTDAGEIVPESSIKIQGGGSIQIQDKGSLVIRDSDSIKILDKDVVDNLNADFIRGKAPGVQEGDLAVFGRNGVILGLATSTLASSSGLTSGSVVTDYLADGAVTSVKILDGTITTSDIASSTIVNANISDTAGITDGKLAQITSSNKVAGSALQLSSSGGLTNNSGVSLLTSCSSNQTLVWNGSSWVCGSAGGSGTITGVTAGNGLTGGGTSGTVTVSVLLPTSGTSANTSSNSGLEVGSSGVSLLKGCSDSQVLTWNSTSGIWQCANQTGGGGGGIATIQEGGSNVVTSATTINFTASDFNVTNSGAGTGLLALDYSNAHITRNNQNETISGNWTFSSASPLAFLSTAPTVSIGNTGTLSITDGTNTLLSLADSGTTGSLSVNAITLSGATGSKVIFTDSSKNLTSTGTVGVAQGGTGLTTFGGTNTLLYTTSADTLSSLTAGTNGQVLVGKTSTAPGFVTLSGDATIDNTGVITLKNTGTAGTYGSATQVPVLTTDVQGRITGVSNTTISGLSGSNIANNSLDFTQFADSLTLDAATSVAFGANNFTLGSSTGNGTLLVAPNAGGQAALVVNKQSTSGDILTASASGTTKFTINNNGNLVATGSLTGLTGLTVASGGETITSGNLAITAGALTLNGTTRIDNGGIGTFASGTVIGSQTFTTNTIADSGALTLSSGGSGNIALNPASGTLTSNATTINYGSAALTVSSCIGCGGSGTNFWRIGSGAISPVNDTVDFLVGNTASTSAKFAVLNVNSGVPVASVSAGTNGAAYITSDGTLATTAKQPLVLGATATGGISIGTDATARSLLIGNGTGASLLSLTAGSGGISLTGNITQTSTGTFSTGTGSVSLNGATTIASGKLFTITGGAGNPTTTNGTVWYDTTANKFKVVEGGSVKVLCNTTDLGCGSGGAGIATVKEGGTSIVTSATSANFNANDFTITDETGGQAGIAVDYTNSKIVRSNQAETITGGWTFNTAGTTFTTGITANGGITTASGTDLSLTSAGSGNIVLNSDFNTGVLIGSSSNVPAVLSVSGGIGSNASLIVNNTNSGDLFTASSSGTTKFTVNNNGNLVATGTLTGLTGLTVASGGETITSGDLAISAGNLTLNGTTRISNAGAGTFTTVNGNTITTGTGTLTLGASKTLTVNGSTTLADNVITLGGGETLTLTAAKNVSFADAFSTSGSFPLTLTTTGSTNVTLPTTGTLVNTAVTTLSSLTSIGTLTGLTVGSTGLTISGATTDITTGSNEDLTVSPNGTGNVVLTSTAVSGVRVGSSSNTPAVLSVSGGIGNNAALVVNNNNNGNLFVASSSGTTKFAIDTSGAVAVAGTTVFNSSAVLQSAALSGTYSNGLTLSNSSNSITVGTLTATGGTIDGISVGATNRSTGAFTTLAANNTVTLSGLGSGTATTSLCLDGSNNVKPCTSGGSTGTLQSDYNNGNTINLSNNNLIIGNTPTGVGNVLINPDAGGNAALIVNKQSTTGNIFTASASGTTKFVIANDGTISKTGYLTGVLHSDSAGLITSSTIVGGDLASNISISTTGNISTTSTGTITSAGLLTGSAGLTVSGGSISLNDSAITNTTSIGGGTTTGAITIGGTGTQTLNIGNGAGVKTVNVGSSNTTSTTTILSGTGNITLGGTTGVGNVQIIPDAGGQAALLIKDQGSGDLLTASAGATTRFTVANTGAVAVSGTTVFNGSGVLQSAALSGTYSNALTLSNSSNSITVGTLTATGGTINNTSIGATTRGSGAFTTLDANSTVTFSSLGGAGTGTTSLCLDGSNNVRTCSSGSSTATLQSAFNNGNSIALGATNLLLGDTTGNGTVFIQPNAGGQASLIIKNQGAGDLLTASAGATTKFTVSNTGGVVASGNISAANFSGSVTGTNTGDQTITLSGDVTGSGTSGITATVAKINGATLGTTTATNKNILIADGSTWVTRALSGDVTLSDNTGTLAIGTGKVTSTMILDGTIAGGDLATNIAISTTGNISTTSTGTITSAGLLTATSGISIGAGQSYTGAGAVTLSSASGTDLTLTAQGSGNTIFSTDFDSGVKIGSSANQLAVLSVSGGISNTAAAIINNTNSGDIFTASASGTPKFTVANNGNITATGALSGATIAAGSNTISGLTNANLSGSAGITNANLANNSITINTTGPIGGGSSVALGGAVTITCTTCITTSGGQTLAGTTTFSDVAPIIFSGVSPTITGNNGDLTVDLTKNATNTLILVNSTVGQVADLNLSDGSLKLGGTTRIANNGTGTFASATVIGSQTFTTNNIADSGPLTIKSATGANALTLDSGSTGDVNLGTSANAKTLTLGNTTGATTINLTKGASGNIVLTGFNCSTLTNGGKLTTDSSGNISCGNDVSGGAGSPSTFQELSGAIVPLNSTEDFLVGAQATTSAKFAVLSINSGTPTASVSSGLNGVSAYLTATGTLATSSKQALTLGDASTGGINIGTDANVHNITIGNTTGGTITIGQSSGSDLALNDAQWSVTGAGAASFASLTSSGTIAANGVGGITSTQSTLIINANGTVDVQDTLNADNITTDIGGVSIAASQSYTGAGAVTLSSANGSTLTINSGTTGALNIGDDASAESINFGTGAAAKTVTIGSTTTTSSTILQSGSGNISLGTTTGVGNVIVQPDAGGNAALVINKQNATGDILSASASGTVKFTITNGGALNLVGGQTSDIDTIGTSNTLKIGVTNQNGLTLGRSGAATTINGSSLTIGPTSWTATPTISGLITDTTGIALGTTPAGAGVLRIPSNTYITSRNNANGGDVNLIKSDTADLIAFGANLAAFTLGGTVSGNNQTISGIGTASFGANNLSISGTTITTAGSNNPITLTPNGSGNTIVTSDALRGLLVGSSTNTPAVLSVSGGIGNNAAFIINNVNNGNLFVASSSGTTKFAIDTNGAVAVAGTTVFNSSAVLQSAALSGTYSNALTLSSASNNITVGTLTATGGTINNTSIGATTRGSGAFTTLDANSTVVFSSLGGAGTGTTSLCLDGSNNVRTCSSGSSTATLQSAYNNGNTINLSNSNLVIGNSFTGVGNVLINPDAGGNAALIINKQSTTGDLFDASASGVLKFAISNGGVMKSLATSNQLVIGDPTATTDTISFSAPASSRTYTVPDFGSNDSFVGLAATQTLTSKTLTSPVINGVTSSGSTAINFSGNSGTFSTSTGANTLSGAVTIADATTPSLTTAAGKTNTGFVQINGKTSGALKITAADAAAQTVTVSLAAQTVGAATLTIPDFANVNDTFTFNTLAATLTNKTIAAGSNTITGITNTNLSSGSFGNITGVGTLVSGTKIDTDTFTNNTITDDGPLTLATGANGNLTLTPNGTGNIILTSTAVSGVRVGSASNTPAVLSVSGGIGSNASFIVNNNNSGDLFTASASGITKFTIKNDGTVVDNGVTIVNASGQVPTTVLNGTLFVAGATSGTTTQNIARGDTLTFTAGTDITTTGSTGVITIADSSTLSSVVGRGSSATAITLTGTSPLTLSGASPTITASNGDVTLDLTKNATNTLILVNSTVGQVADLNLSDGSLKLGNTTRIANNGTGTFIAGTTIGTQTFNTNAIADSGALTISTGASGDLTLTPNSIGNIVLTSTAISGVRVGSSTNTPGVLSVSGGIGNNAAFIVNNNNNGNLFVASSSGTTKFAIDTNGTVAVAGTTVFNSSALLQSAALSGTYSNALTLSNSSNNFTIGTLTATGGTINSTSIGATTRSSGAFTTLAANAAVTLSGIGSSGTTALCLNGSNIETCTTGSSAGTLQSDYNNGNTINLSNNNLIFGNTFTGTGNILINPQAGGQAALILNKQSTVGDVFTASSSGTARFTINNNGNLVATGTLTGLTGLTVASGGETITSGDLAITAGNLTLNGSTRISNAGVGTFAGNTVIGTDTFTANNILDSGALTIKSASGSNLTLDSNGGTSALNLGNTNATTIQIGNNTTNPGLTLDSGTGTIAIGTGAQTRTINIGTGAAAQTITIGSTSTTSALTLQSGSGGIVLGTTTGVGNITIQPDAGGKAGLIVNKQGVLGDIFTASASGSTKFVINQTGQVGIGTTSILAQAGLEIDRNGLGNAIAVLNQLGSGDIFTASASGTSKFTISNNGNTGIVGLPKSNSRLFINTTDETQSALKIWHGTMVSDGFSTHTAAHQAAMYVTGAHVSPTSGSTGPDLANFYITYQGDLSLVSGSIEGTEAVTSLDNVTVAPTQVILAFEANVSNSFANTGITFPDVRGIYGDVNLGVNNAGTYTWARSVSGQQPAAATGTTGNAITNAASLYAFGSGIGTGVTPTNAYGLYVENPSRGTNIWGAYINGKVQTVGAGSNAITFANTDQTGNGFWIRNDGTNNVISSSVGDMYFGYNGNAGMKYHFYPGGTATDEFTIDGSGHVGIGTLGAPPAYGLTIDTGANNNLRIRTAGSTRYRSDYFINGASGVTMNAFDDTGAVYLPFEIDGSTITLGNASNTALKFGKFSTANQALYISATDGTVAGVAVNSGATLCLTQTSSAAPVWGSCAGGSLQGSYSGGNTINLSNNNLIIGNSFTGVGNVLINPDAGGAAALIVNKVGTVGDIFTASASGTTKFVINQSGQVGIGATSPTNTLEIQDTGATSTRGLLISEYPGANIAGALVTLSKARGSKATPTTVFAGDVIGNMRFSGYDNTNSIDVADIKAIADQTFTSGTSTGHGTYLSFFTTPDALNAAVTESLRITASGSALLVGGQTSDIDTLTATSLKIGASTANAITIGNSTANTAITLTSGGTGNITLGGNTGVGNIIVQPNAGGQAGLIVNSQSVGDLFTASASGTTRFRITNTGGVLFQGDVITSIGSLTSGTPSQTNQTAVINAMGDQGSMVPNAGFESVALGNTFADGWTVAATSPATMVTRIATDSAKGNSSALVKLQASTSTAIYSPCIPLSVAITAVYALNFYANTSNTSPVIRGYLDTYANQGNCQSDSSRTVFATPTTANSVAGWRVYAGSATGITTSGTNKWGRVHIFVGCPASCAANTTVGLDGVRLVEADGSKGLDYAENYPADPTDIPGPGDLVTLEPGKGLALVKRTSIENDPSMIGVVSTNPGQTLDDGTIAEPKVPVALAGRIPTKVSTQNGPIQVGDFLTSSTIPGVAVKAMRPGQVIGTAMEEYTSADTTAIGKVVMFVKNTYYQGASGLAGAGTGITTLIGEDGTSVQLEEKNGTLVIKADDGSDAITFDKSGNATFAGIVTAKEIRADHISGLDALTSEIASLSAHVGETTGVLAVATNAADMSLNTINVNGLATISGNLRVKGSGLFEGVVSIIDTLTAHNLLITGVTDFFGNVIFHNDVTLQGRPTFNSDTAGFAVIKKNAQSVTVTFDKDYMDAPIVTASISLTTGNDATQSAALSGITYAVTNRTKHGFTITVSGPAQEDIEFSWTALFVKDAKTSVGQ